MPLPTSDISNLNACLKTLDEPRCQRQCHIDECGIENVGAHFAHELLELRVPGVGHTPTASEAVHNVVLNVTHQRDELEHVCQVARSRLPSQRCCVLRGQAVSTVRRIVLNDSPRHHRSKPFPHIPLVQIGCIRNLLTRRWRHLRQHVEQPSSVPDACHKREHSAVHDPQHLTAESFRLGLIQLNCGHFSLSLMISFCLETLGGIDSCGSTSGDVGRH